ncbi:Methanogenesis regulatory protein FilR1 [uncultured archaeon]|nr:Methanogenesis regulatory protein FilR1 [uncultured archaeon]
MSKLIGAITHSRKRESLLIFLRDGPKTLEEIRKSLEVTSAGMIPQIRKLEEVNLVRQEGKTYALTEIGMIIAEVFNSFSRTIDIVEKYEDFWTDHEIKAIPQYLLNRIYELENSTLIESKMSEIFEPHREFVEALIKSKHIKGVSPIFHPQYPPFFLQLAMGGAETSLILTRDVFNRAKNDYLETMRKTLSFPGQRLYVSDEDIKVAGTVTNCFFSLSLFFKNGGYDSQKDLESSDSSAIKWGEDLFDHFLSKAKEIKRI